MALSHIGPNLEPCQFCKGEAKYEAQISRTEHSIRAGCSRCSLWTQWYTQTCANNDEATAIMAANIGVFEIEAMEAVADSWNSRSKQVNRK